MTLGVAEIPRTGSLDDYVAKLEFSEDGEDDKDDKHMTKDPL